MSSTPSRADATETVAPKSDTLTDEEREAFEDLAETYEGEELGRFFEAVLQSSEANEEANS